MGTVIIMYMGTAIMQMDTVFIMYMAIIIIMYISNVSIMCIATVILHTYKTTTVISQPLLTTYVGCFFRCLAGSTTMGIDIKSDFFHWTRRQRIKYSTEYVD